MGGGNTGSSILPLSDVSDALGNISTEISTFVSDNFSVILTIAGAFIGVAFVWWMIKLLKRSSKSA